MRDIRVWMVVGLACVIAGAGCGKKEGGKAGGDQPATGDERGGGNDKGGNDKGGNDKGGNDKPAAAGNWNEGAVSFKASWTTEGEATRKSKQPKLTGTLYVGPEAIRLDIDNHPNAGGKVSFIKPIEEDEMWQLDAANKRLDRALSGDWEHNIVPFVIEADDVEDILEGECPFGGGDECKQVGSEKVAGRDVQKWEYRKKVYWVDPTLRTALRQQYTPYRNNPGVQTIELSNIVVGEQDATLFLAPADYQCKAGSFCDSAPVAK